MSTAQKVAYFPSNVWKTLRIRKCFYFDKHFLTSISSPSNQDSTFPILFYIFQTKASYSSVSHYSKNNSIFGLYSKSNTTLNSSQGLDLSSTGVAINQMIQDLIWRVLGKSSRGTHDKDQLYQSSNHRLFDLRLQQLRTQHRTVRLVNDFQVVTPIHQTYIFCI